MKKILLPAILTFTIVVSGFTQNMANRNEHNEAIQSLIEDYTRSRETKDTTLLRSILMPEIDQLVSSGEWRIGIETATKGMMQSSATNPGERTITIEQIRFINPESAIVDARYEIHNSDGTARKMWSTFIVVRANDKWKITAIRNMLPAK